jgi:tetratricopeptide (TPR) repeat protein
MSQQMDQQQQQVMYKRAQTFLKTGEYKAAEDVCDSVLKSFPQDANFMCMSAHALIRLNRYDEAQRRLELAIKLFPEFDSGYDACGDLFLAQGKLDDAVKAYQHALKINPKRQQTQMKLSQAFSQIGEKEKAEDLKDKIFENDQSFKEMDKAVQLEKEEKFDEAENIYRAVLLSDPDNVTAIRLWAALGTKQRFFAEAEVLLNRAVELAPDYSHAWHDLFKVQQEQDKYEESIETANMLIKLEPTSPRPITLLAAAYAASGDHQKAIDLYDQALELAPNHVSAMCGKGNSCRTFGSYDDAIAAFRKSIETNPFHAEPYWSLANLKVFKFEQKEVDDMVALVGDERIPEEGQVQLNNALSHEFHNRKEYDRAFEYLDRCNNLRRIQEYYDPVETEELVNTLISTFSPEFISENADKGDPDGAPILIVGLPRSGSTLLEQILSSHSKVDGTFELRDLSKTTRLLPEFRAKGIMYPNNLTLIEQSKFKELGAEYIKKTQRHRSDLPYFTDKNPNNFMHIGFLHLILPNAKVINARRHPLDSCFGSYKQLFASGQSFTYDLIELGEYYLQYQRVMDYWQEVMPDKVLDVQYEDVVADTETQIRRILDHCGLNFEESCVNFHQSDRAVKTASSEQVRQPIYASSVHTWRHYEEHLGDLIEVLEPLLINLPEKDRPLSLGGKV